MFAGGSGAQGTTTESTALLADTSIALLLKHACSTRPSHPALYIKADMLLQNVIIIQTYCKTAWHVLDCTDSFNPQRNDMLFATSFVMSRQALSRDCCQMSAVL